MIDGILHAGWPAFLVVGGLVYVIIVNIGLIFFASPKEGSK